MSESPAGGKRRLIAVALLSLLAGVVGLLVTNPLSADTETTISVQARGDAGGERLEIIADGEVLDTLTLSRTLTSFDVVAPRHPSNVRVSFINDSRANGVDRNAVVEYIELAGKQYRTTDPSVLSTGTYMQGRGCTAGTARSVRLHCNGYFEFRIDALPASVVSGQTRIEVRAEGATGEERIELRVGSTALAKWTLTQDARSYIHNTDTQILGADVEVHFVNDARSNRGDRNAHIDFLAVDGQKLEAEDPSVFSTGSYTRSNGCDGGNKQSETLHCDGFFRFSIPEGEAVEPPAEAEPATAAQPEVADVASDTAEAEAGGSDEAEESQEPAAQPIQGVLGASTSPNEESPDEESVADVAPTTTTTTAPPAEAESVDVSAAPATAVKVAAFPKAGNNGEVGCVENCRNVGFQNLDGKRNVTLENLIISNPGGQCISIKNASNITIKNVTVRDCATNTRSNRNAIVDITDSSNVTITGSKFVDNSNRNVTNYDLIHIDNASGVTIRNNEIRDVHSNTGSNDRGNRAILVTGDRSDNLVIEHNSMHNPGRNAVQISRARQLTGVKITNNRIEGRARWDSEFEDMINFYSASGTAASPMIVADNYMRNGGPSDSGTAIILGDGEGNQASAYITVERNVIVDPGHVGINVAGGHHFIVRDNIIFGGSDVKVWTATGLTINHYRYTPECRDHQIYDNQVYFKNQHRQHNGTNHMWNPGTCRDNVKFYNNDIGDRSLSYDVWDLD